LKVVVLDLIVVLWDLKGRVVLFVLVNAFAVRKFITFRKLNDVLQGFEVL